MRTAPHGGEKKRGPETDAGDQWQGYDGQLFRERGRVTPSQFGDLVARVAERDLRDRSAELVDDDGEAAMGDAKEWESLLDRPKACEARQLPCRHRTRDPAVVGQIDDGLGSSVVPVRYDGMGKERFEAEDYRVRESRAPGLERSVGLNLSTVGGGVAEEGS